MISIKIEKKNPRVLYIEQLDRDASKIKRTDKSIDLALSSYRDCIEVNYTINYFL